MTAQTALTSQTPSTDDNDVGSQHLYGDELTISDGGVLQATGNRYWCPSVKPSNPWWGVWDDINNALIVGVDLVAADLTINAWNPVPDLGTTYDLTGITEITVFGQWWFGHQPYTLSPGYPIAGSGPDITITNGCFGTGSGTGGPRQSGGSFALLAFADVAIVFGAPSEVTLTPVSVTATAIAVTAAPQPVTVALTPLGLSLGATALAATAGAVTVALTPVTVVVAAVSLGLHPQPVTVALTAAAVTLAAVALSTGARCTVSRPFTGVVARPNTGTVVRP